jgi:hypothetical protein
MERLERSAKGAGGCRISSIRSLPLTSDVEDKSELPFIGPVTSVSDPCVANAAYWGRIMKIRIGLSFSSQAISRCYY